MSLWFRFLKWLFPRQYKYPEYLLVGIALNNASDGDLVMIRLT